MSADQGLAAFLAARLDEDEKAAQSALRWHETGSCVYIAIYASTWQALDDYDPDRALRDIAAKRTILDMYTSTLALVEHPLVIEEGQFTGKISVQDYMDAKRELAVLRPAVTALAAIWSDHPDYGQERKAVSQ